jgi:methylmalonyl-CoA/ethylmalonyl-CoA epimerase
MNEPRVAHIGIAVSSLAEALPFYRDVLGLTPGRPETADGASIVSLHFGDVDVELLEPIDPAGPVARFLARRGPGIHHVCYRVPDLDAALARCRAASSMRPRGAGSAAVASPSCIPRRPTAFCSN